MTEMRLFKHDISVNDFTFKSTWQQIQAIHGSSLNRQHQNDVVKMNHLKKWLDADKTILIMDSIWYLHSIQNDILECKSWLW